MYHQQQHHHIQSHDSRHTPYFYYSQLPLRKAYYLISHEIIFSLYLPTTSLQLVTSYPIIYPILTPGHSYLCLTTYVHDDINTHIILSQTDNFRLILFSLNFAESSEFRKTDKKFIEICRGNRNRKKRKPFFNLFHSNQSINQSIDTKMCFLQYTGDVSVG